MNTNGTQQTISQPQTNQASPQSQPVQGQQDSFENFDPMQDIDVSGIEIIDTAKGDSIDFSSIAYNEVFSFRCRNCGFKYEGKQRYDECPRCGSSELEDVDSQ